GGDAGARRGRSRLCQQRVEEDDAARTAESGDVGVHLPRAAAGVGDEHVSDGGARPLRESLEISSERRVTERREAVEEGLDGDGGEEGGEENCERGAACRREGPEPGERPGEADKAEQ